MSTEPVEVGVLRRLAEKLDPLMLDFVVGGSYASSIWGHPRQTNDIDVSIWLQESEVDAFIVAIQPEFLIQPATVLEAVTSHEVFRCFQLIDSLEFFKVDVFVPQDDEFSKSAWSRKRAVPIWEDCEVMAYAPEDIALQKLRWYELGNRTSDRQWNDVMGVIEVQGDQFDRAYFLDWADKLRLGDLSREALAEGRI